MPSAPADVTLKIPRPLYEQLGQVIDGTGFRSVTEFAVYVLRDLVASHGAERLAHRPSSSRARSSTRCAGACRRSATWSQAQARSESAGEVSSERTRPWRSA